MNWAWFDGKMSAHRFQEEHPRATTSVDDGED